MAISQARDPGVAGSSIAGISTEALIAGSAAVTGMVLWIGGGRLLRPAITLTGTLAGALMGSALAAGLQLPDLHGVPAGYIGIALGGLLGLGLSLILYRVAVAGVAGVGLGVAAATTAALCVGIGAASLSRENTANETSITSEQPRQAASRLSQVRDGLATLSLDDLEQVRQHLAGTVQHRSLPTSEIVPTSIRSAGEQIQESAAAQWDSLGSEPRVAMTASAVIGALVGGLMGLLMPRRAGALVTALAGSALWLGGGVALAARYAPELSQQQWITWTLAHPPAWALIWVLMGLLGMMAQMSGEKPPVPQPVKAPAPAPAK